MLSTLCPTGWFSYDGACYTVTATGTVSAFGCNTLCEAANASLACSVPPDLGQLLNGTNGTVWKWGWDESPWHGRPAKLLWTGIFMLPGDAEVLCSSGKAFDGMTTIDPRPQWSMDSRDYSGKSGSGRCTIASYPPRGYLFWYPCHNVELMAHHCLCELGASTSTAWVDFGEAETLRIKAIEETGNELYRTRLERHRQRAPVLTATLFAIVGSLSLLPAIVFRRFRCVRTQVVEGTSTGHVTIPIQPLQRFAWAENAADNARIRFVYLTCQIGWTLMLISLVPALMCGFYREVKLLDYGVGNYGYYLGGLPWGICVTVLMLRPINAWMIRRACMVVSIVYLLSGLLLAVSISFSIGGKNRDLKVACLSSFAVIFFILGVFVWPTRVPRRQLQCLWISLQCALLLGALLCAFFLLSRCLTHGRIELTSMALSAVSHRVYICNLASCILALLVCRSTTRTYLQRWLAKTCTRDAEEFSDAAVIVAFLGAGVGRGNAERQAAIATAMERFRAIPLKDLEPTMMTVTETDIETEDCAHLMASSNRSAATRSLDMTVPAVMGQVDAFISHSWRDPAELKHHSLTSWANEHEKAFSEILLWCDGVCLDRNDISASLQYLPFFIASCQKLLVLAGSSYSTRLWCAMEIFLFLRMGRRPEDAIIRIIGNDQGPILLAMSRFKVYRARCSSSEDRHRLLAIIEASDGTAALFDQAIRRMFCIDSHSR